MARRLVFLGVVLGSWSVAERAEAAPTTDPTQAPAGAIVIHFEEVAIGAGTDVTNQFAAYGVDFSGPSPWALENSGGYPGIFAEALDNFSGSAYCQTTYSIVFAAPVAFAGFNIVTNAGDNTDLIATLGGV